MIGGDDKCDYEAVSLSVSYKGWQVTGVRSGRSNGDFVTFVTGREAQKTSLAK